MNIYEKLSAITVELQTVAKNLTVQTSTKSAYKAVSERDILDAVKPIEAKYKVYSYPCDREVIESNLLESENQNGKKTTLMTRIKTVYRFVNIEKPDEYVETTVFSEGMDAQDKGAGKAMTYADKYALMKAYKISTGDDPDIEASKDEHYQKPRTMEYTKPKSVKDELMEQLKEILIYKGVNPKDFAKENGLKSSSSEDFIKELINKAGLL